MSSEPKFDEVINDAIGMVVSATKSTVNSSVKTRFEKTSKLYPWEKDFVPQEFKVTKIKITIIEKL